MKLQYVCFERSVKLEPEQESENVWRYVQPRNSGVVCESTALGALPTSERWPLPDGAGDTAKRTVM